MKSIFSILPFTNSSLRLTNDDDDDDDDDEDDDEEEFGVDDDRIC
jgi:hypothetical protein